jgi:hypothetical protein
MRLHEQQPHSLLANYSASGTLVRERCYLLPTRSGFRSYAIVSVFLVVVPWCFRLGCICPWLSIRDAFMLQDESASPRFVGPASGQLLFLPVRIKLTGE